MLHLQFYGGHKAVARPDPIPNSAVKHRIADGSACIACARVGSRQTFKSRTSKESGFLLFKTKFYQKRTILKIGAIVGWIIIFLG